MRDIIPEFVAVEAKELLDTTCERAQREFSAEQIKNFAFSIYSA